MTLRHATSIRWLLGLAQGRISVAVAQPFPRKPVKIVVIDALNAAVNDGLRSPDMQASLAKLGLESKIQLPQELAAALVRDGPRDAGRPEILAIPCA
jgi:hypothetical protein